IGAPAQQTGGTEHVAALGMGDTHGDLGKTAPQLPLGLGRGLPHRLEHFVGGESVSFVEQFLGLGQPFVRGELGVVGNSFDLTDASVRQGSTITIPRPLVLRAAALVTIPVTVSGLRPHSCLTTSSPRPPKAWHRRSRATSLRVAPRPRWVAPRAG